MFALLTFDFAVDAQTIAARTGPRKRVALAQRNLKLDRQRVD
jgi:hypothetical protein